MAGLPAQESDIKAPVLIRHRCDRCHLQRCNSKIHLGRQAPRLQFLRVHRKTTTVLTCFHLGMTKDELLKWLFPDFADIEARHRAVALNRVEGTGNWLRESKEYKNWINRPAPQILYCHGEGLALQNRCCPVTNGW